MNSVMMKTMLKKLANITALILLLLSATNQAYAAEKITYYHYDLLGSPVATTNELGEVIWREEYGPWGEKLLDEDATHDNVRDYTGHVHDRETGLTYMQARYYDPQIGRFMGIDPIGFQEDNPIMFNRYAYANNNPYKFKDPNGETADVAAAWGIAFAEPTPFGEIAAALYTLGRYTLAGLLAGIALNEISDDETSEEDKDTDTDTIGVSSDNQLGKEKKGRTQSEVGSCPNCGGSTSNKPGKIGSIHGKSVKEVKETIHGIKQGANLPGNPDVEVCNNCGEVSPQTEDGTLGDSIGNINDGF